MFRRRYAEDLVVSSALGADMFDCVYPTRTAVILVILYYVMLCYVAFMLCLCYVMFMLCYIIIELLYYEN